MEPGSYPAEYVLPGHPDKLCDAIADALVAEGARHEQRALCGVEVALHRQCVFVTGRIACQSARTFNVGQVVREVFASAGYGARWNPEPEKLKVRTDLCLRPLEEGEADYRAVADDQTISVGYAVDLPETNCLPPEHWLAWRLARRLDGLHTGRPELELGPDGKVVLALEQGSGGALRLASFSTSLQQGLGADLLGLHRAVREALAEELEAARVALPGMDPALPEVVRVNGAGNFAVDGPEGDNGLSGKKLVVDAYGPRVPIGGGALSGKDFYKADRAGALIARRLAKAVVLTGLACECTATIAFFPGDERARLLALRGPGGRPIPVARWADLIDPTLAGSGERYARNADYGELARWGHFTHPKAPWEKIGL